MISDKRVRQLATFFLILIYLAFISLGLPDSLLGTAWPIMQTDIQAPFQTAGYLFMIVTAGTIVSSLASGTMLKRFGTGKVTLVSCAMTAAALFGYAMSPSFVWLIISAIPLGLGAGSVDAGLNNYVAEHYRAHHMNWLHCFWGVGATLGPIIMSQYMLQEGHWRNGYYTVAVIQSVLVIILAVTLPLWKRMEKHREGSATEGEGLHNSQATSEHIDSTNVHPLRVKGVKIALVSFFFYCGLEGTVGLWGSSYLVQIKDISAASAAMWVSLYYGGITAGRLISGFIALRMSNKTLIRSGQLIALLGTVLLLLPLPSIVSAIGLVTLGLGLAPIYPSMLHETPSRFGSSASQRIMGYQMAVAYTGTTVVPPLLGFLAGQTSISILPVYLLLCAAVMLIFSERMNVFLRKRRAGDGMTHSLE